MVPRDFLWPLYDALARLVDDTYKHRSRQRPPLGMV